MTIKRVVSLFAMFLATSVAYTQIYAPEIKVEGTNGNVGINTNNPQSPLDVRGTIRSTEPGILTEGTGCELRYFPDWGWGGILTFDRTNTGYLPTKVIGSEITLGLSGNDNFRLIQDDHLLLNLIRDQNIGVQLGINNNQDGFFNIYDNSGSATCRIRGYAADNVQAFFNAGRVEINSPLGTMGLQIANKNNAAFKIGDGNLGLYMDSNEIHCFDEDGIEGSGLHIQGSDVAGNTILNNTSGNVGIGTTSPNYKLEVSGIVRANTFNAVSPPWSDFVFESSYDLITLNELENFIQQNKHLPDIPSEKEVKELGINLAEMDAKLLQKVEELTLYIIQQNKEIEKMKMEIQRLKNSK